MDEATRSDLTRIRAAVDVMSDLAGQDTGLVREMTLDMLGAVIEGRGLAPTIDYVRHYCDVVDSPEDAARIAADISQAALDAVLEDPELG